MNPPLRWSLLSASLLWTVLAVSCGRSSSRVSATGPLFPVTGMIGDQVWLDADRDGIQEAGESGMAGLLVRLESLDGAGHRSTTTDSNGLYSFTGLPAGSYLVRFTLPDGFLSSPADMGGDDELDSDGEVVPVVLVPASGGGEILPNRSIDFGCYAPDAAEGKLGDFVWHDLNCDGLQDAGEPGINGVRVILRDGAGNQIDEEVTGTNQTGDPGYYLFDRLPEGYFTLEVDPSTLPPKFFPAPSRVGSDRTMDSDGSPATVRFETGRRVDATVDFGYCSICTGSIGDQVWLDADGNGCQDPGEAGIPGVRILLRIPGGQQIAETRTNASGGYAFLGLCGGDYSVEVDFASLPTGYRSAPNQACADPARDSHDSPIAVRLSHDRSMNPSVDFGFVSPENAILAGRVWDDRNNDGLQDLAEPSLEGVRVLLRDAGSAVVATAFTSLGGYRFGGLLAGKYTVEVDVTTLPSGAKLSPCRVGADRTIDNDCSPVTWTLARGQVEDHVDVGYAFPATGSIGSFVWHDLDVDGIQEPGERGMSGVRVILMDAQRRVLATRVSDQFGNYEFDRLAPGAYRVEFDPKTCPPGFRRTKCGKGPDRSKDSDCLPVILDLRAGEQNHTVDFGFYALCYKEIGDFVWIDTDGDGLQDANEPGIESVEVVLRDQAGILVAREVTDHRGYYCFKGVCPGDFRISIDPTSLPPGLVPTKCGVGSDRTVDSDCSPVYLRLEANAVPDHSIDFGFTRAGVAFLQAGCSSSFWLLPESLGFWPVDPATPFGNVFVDVFPGKSLRDVVGQGGGSLNGLARDMVAAYLNAESAQIRYPLTSAQIRQLFEQHFAGSGREGFTLKKNVEERNKRGFPLR